MSPISSSEPSPTVEPMRVDESTSQTQTPFNIHPLSTLREIAMLVCLVSTQALGQACLAQGIFPDRVIGTSFGASDEESSWGPAAYALTSGTFMLPAGRIADMYGYRRCYVAGWIWFAVSSLLTGISVYSKTLVFYCVCRGLQGMATAMLVPCALAILGTVYKDGPRKNRAFSLYAAGAPIGFTLGGIFSGVVADLAWWPWCFWITALVCAGLAFMAMLTVPDLSKASHSPAGTVSGSHDFDWAGTAAGVSGLILFNVAWNQAPIIGWSETSTITTVVIGFILCIGFVLIEQRAKRPLIPILGLSSNSLYVLATMALAWASFGVLIFYMVNFITRIRGASIINAATQFLPVPITGLLASGLNSFLMGRRISAADILAFSSIWFIAGNVLLATMPVKQSYWLQMFWISVLAPFGMDLSFPSATLLISETVPPEQQGMAASLIATVVYYSQSIGLGIAGTVQRYTADGSLLKGYRGATYTGVALSGLSLLVALCPVLGLRLRTRAQS